jgi:Cytochrome c
MSQQKYIISAILLLVVIAIIYFGLKRFSESENTKSSSMVIDKDKKGDSILPVQEIGKVLYYNKCMSCHGSFRKTDGPWLSLAGFPSRWPDKKELFAFIRNPAEIIGRSAYAKELKETYRSVMTPFPDLTDKEIQAILDYITYEKKLIKTG